MLTRGKPQHGDVSLGTQPFRFLLTFHYGTAAKPLKVPYKRTKTISFCAEAIIILKLFFQFLTDLLNRPSEISCNERKHVSIFFYIKMAIRCFLVSIYFLPPKTGINLVVTHAGMVCWIVHYLFCAFPNAKLTFLALHHFAFEKRQKESWRGVWEKAQLVTQYLGQSPFAFFSELCSMWRKLFCLSMQEVRCFCVE